jgi:hypothetical protein
MQQDSVHFSSLLILVVRVSVPPSNDSIRANMLRFQNQYPPRRSLTDRFTFMTR